MKNTFNQNTVFFKIWACRIEILAIIFFFFGMFFRLQHRFLTPLVGDELYSVRMLDNPWDVFLYQVTRHDFCGYLNGELFLNYPFFQVFGFNKWGLIIPHFMATVLGFYFFYLVTRIYLHHILSFFFAFALYALNDTLIHTSLEARPYPFLPTMALGIFLLFHKIANRKSEPSDRQKIIEGLVVAPCIIFHTYGIIIVFFIFLYFFAGKISLSAIRNNFRKLCVYAIPILLIVGPIYFLTFVNTHRLDVVTKEGTFFYIPHPLDNPAGFFKGVFGNLTGCRKFYFLLIPFFLSFFIPDKDWKRRLKFFSYLIFFPIVVILDLDMMNGYWFIQRQMAWIMPFFAIMLTWSFDVSYSLVLTAFRKNVRVSN